MHNNGIIITKEFISHWNTEWLRGSVGRAKKHFGYIFVKSNEIVVRNPTSKLFFLLLLSLLLHVVCCLVCV